MNIIDQVIYGFSVALTFENLLYCLAGAVLGTVVGILPGLAPVTTIAMLIPITFHMPAVGALIMLAGIFYGAHHAAATTAIMLNMPGEPSSVVICLDGHPMARKGRAGPALFVAAIASFFAGCVGVVVIALLSPMLASISLKFGPAEYTSLIVMALVTTSVIASNSLSTTIGMAVLGVILGTVGIDLETGQLRFAFGMSGLVEGLSFVAVAVGLFAITEIVLNLTDAHSKVIASPTLRNLIPTRDDISRSWKPILRGTSLGSVLGVLPGMGPLFSSFAAYVLEKRLSKQPERFGHGAIEGVAGPEAANNAAALSHFIPMLTLGIPGGAVFALMLGAMTIQGIQPGPKIMVEHPDAFWGLIASMLLGNMMLLVINLPLIGVWLKLLSVPYRILYPVVLGFCCIGVLSVSNNPFDVGIAVVFGFVGIVFAQFNVSPMPLVLGLVLGPMLEENFRRAMLISRGDPAVFVTSPISLTILIFTVLMVFVISLPHLSKRQRGTEAAPASTEELLADD